MSLEYIDRGSLDEDNSCETPGDGMNNATFRTPTIPSRVSSNHVSYTDFSFRKI